MKKGQKAERPYVKRVPLKGNHYFSTAVTLTMDQINNVKELAGKTDSNFSAVTRDALDMYFKALKING